jgi:hypothetical protein
LQALDTYQGQVPLLGEMPNAEDAYDPSVKAERKRIDCSCFVDGDQ